jgi:hypothetical protein
MIYPPPPPAFSNAAIRRLTGVFYDSAYKVEIIPVMLHNGSKPV